MKLRCKRCNKNTTHIHEIIQRKKPLIFKNRDRVTGEVTDIIIKDTIVYRCQFCNDEKYGTNKQANFSFGLI